MIIPADYKWVLASGLAISLHAFLQGAPVGACRKKLFPVEFMEKEWGAVHRDQLGEDIKAGGYPDTGSGFYSQKLTYKDWYTFNILQRVHLNYLEQLPLALASILSAGVYYPKQAAGLGVLFLVTKIIASHFYKEKGGASNTLRRVGQGLSYLAVLSNIVLFGCGLYASCKK